MVPDNELKTYRLSVDSILYIENSLISLQFIIVIIVISTFIVHTLIYCRT